MKESLEEFEKRLKEAFFLRYHLGLSRQQIQELSADDRLWLINRFIETRRK